MMKLFNNHLFWFVVLGILIFVIDKQTSDPLDTIVVDAALERRVAALWAAQVQREPTETELSNLVTGWVTEEIWRREAIRLNLAEEDEIIRRRMIQKMQFIAEQEAELAPTDAELRAYYDKNRARYEISSNVSFEQLRFDSSDAAIAAKKTGESLADLAEASMQNRMNVRKSTREITSTFGPGFNTSLGMINVAETWQGPIQSAFGWHWVKVLEKNPPSVATFEDVRASLIGDYAYDTRLMAQSKFIEQARPRYDIVHKDQ